MGCQQVQMAVILECTAHEALNAEICRVAAAEPRELVARVRDAAAFEQLGHLHRDSAEELQCKRTLHQ